MTLEAYSSLPFSAGSAVATAAGRGALWAVGTYMREPARNTAIAALVGLSMLAGGNALYKQAHHHPAPLFGSFAAPPPAAVKAVRPAKPVFPVDRPAKLGIDTSETTGSLAPQVATPVAAPAPTIGNDQVLVLQKKLAALTFFSGTADGMFGPRTARAIKSFEQSVGRPQHGLLTQQILDLVAAATVPVAAPPPATVATAPVQAPVATAVKAPAPLLLPAPVPLVATTSGAPAAPADALASLDKPDTGAQTLPMSDPAIVPHRVVQTIAVHAETGQPMPSALAPAQADEASTDPDTVAAVQRGLNSLGFLHGEIDGVAGETTARAIRNFEVFYNYDVTGQITPDLVGLLKEKGATI